MKRLSLIFLWLCLFPVFAVQAETISEGKGDLNHDGTVDFLDVVILNGQWLHTGAGLTADVDDSNEVDLRDFTLIMSEWLDSIVTDTFDDSNSLNNWEVVDEGTIESPSAWATADGVLCELSQIAGPDTSATSNRKGSYAYWKDPAAFFWTDYRFDVSVQSTDTDGIGVMFRYEDPNNYYKFEMDTQKNFRKLFKMHNGVETTLASTAAGYPLSQWMRLSVQAVGDEFEILLDGENVFGGAITDGDLPGGTVALYNWGNAGSYFGNFKTHVIFKKNVFANNDNYQTVRDTPLQVTTDGTLVNDIAEIGTLSARLIAEPQHGNLTFNPDGNFTYTPNVNYTGWDNFTYEATNSQQTDQAEVTIRVQEEPEFSIIVLPDTQCYAAYYPQIYVSQTQWIADNIDNRHIALVLHEGDITNNNYTYQWDNADAAMSILDGEIPYVLVPGNHDTGPGGNSGNRDVTLFNQYFPVSRFSGLPQFGGVFETNHIENSYHYFTAGGIDWLVMALEFGPRNAVLDWANQIVNDNPHRRVIVLTHNYMYSDDTRVGAGDAWNPHYYNLCQGVTEPNTCNDGDEMWTKFVKLHENISFVFSGHILNDGTGKLVSDGDHGNKVYQMLANYQFESNGGNGYLRIVTIYPEQQKVRVETYSPWLDQYRTEPDQQFEFTNVDLTTP